MTRPLVCSEDFLIDDNYAGLDAATGACGSGPAQKRWLCCKLGPFLEIYFHERGIRPYSRHWNSPDDRTLRYAVVNLLLLVLLRQMLALAYREAARKYQWARGTIRASAGMRNRLSTQLRKTAPRFPVSYDSAA